MLQYWECNHVKLHLLIIIMRSPSHNSHENILMKLRLLFKPELAVLQKQNKKVILVMLFSHCLAKSCLYTCTRVKKEAGWTIFCDHSNQDWPCFVLWWGEEYSRMLAWCAHSPGKMFTLSLLFHKSSAKCSLDLTQHGTGSPLPGYVFRFAYDWHMVLVNNTLFLRGSTTNGGQSMHFQMVAWLLVFTILFMRNLFI